MRRLLAVVLASLLFLGADAFGDTVHLKDGRVIEGTIVEQTRSTVVIDAVIANITTRMTLRVRDIESIDEGTPTPEAAPHERPAAPATTPTRRLPVATTAEPYLSVPIRGVFGEDIGPTGVRNVIEYAQRRGIRHIVFEIDSPGGYVWAAEEISEILADRPDSITCYALIDNAISAAIWVALSCDEVYIRPGGTFGGAVAYSHDSSTGSVEVDAKFNSILAAKLAGISEDHGHDPAVARAMVLLDAELYAEKNDSGGYTLVNSPSPAAVTLATDTSILTLTGAQVGEYGIGTVFDGDAQALGDTLGIEGWTLSSNFGEAAMRRGQRDLKKRADLMKDLSRLNLEFDLAVAFLNENDPTAGEYRVHEGGAMTAVSIKLWRQRTDACIDACENIQRIIHEFDALEQRASRMGIKDLLDRDDIREWRGRTGELIKRLRRDRNRTSI